MKKAFVFILVCFVGTLNLKSENNDSLVSLQPRNVIELGVRNITNWMDGNGWIGESTNVYSVLSYSRRLLKYKLVMGLEYYEFETYKLRSIDYQSETRYGKVYNLCEYREFKHLKYSIGKYFETKRIDFTGKANINYLFGGFEGRYLGEYQATNGLGPIFGNSTMKGWGYGFGMDIKYKIKQKYIIGLDFNYGAYNLKREFHIHNILWTNNDNPPRYNENTQGVDIYNKMWSLHCKFGIML